MPSRKIIISVAGVILFLAAGAFTMMFKPSEREPAPSRKSAPVPQAKEVPAPVQTPPAPAPEPEPPVPAEYFVYITGAVKKPGVYKFKDGARIYQAVEAAGGFTKNADVASLNLADFLEDRMQINVGVIGAAQSSRQTVSVPSSGTGGLVNVNTASLQELQTLKGVGPSLAKRIIDYRQSHGGFSRPDDLLNVKGIGRSALEKFRAQLTFSGGVSRSASSSGGLININTASAQELQRLKGIGPALAKRIVEYRQAHGAFSSPEDLVNVRGIGPATLSKFRSQIEVR